MLKLWVGAGSAAGRWPLLADRGVLRRRFEALIFKHDLATVNSQSEAMVIACDRSIV